MDEFNKDEFIESIINKYGEEQLEEFIGEYYSGECEKLDNLSDLDKLNEEEIENFIDEYEEYLEETELVDEEIEDWGDYTDYDNDN